jgi:UDP-glucose 4-epimerase
MLSGNQVMINGDGQQERDFVHVTDCARANLLALTTDNIGVFNIGSKKGTTVNQIFFHLKEIIGYPMEVVFGPPIVGETRRIFLDAGRAYAELGWKPKIGLKEGLESTVPYFDRPKAPIKKERQP